MRKSAILFMLSLAIISCKKDSIQDNLPKTTSDSLIITSKFQVNPYSLSRMQAAFDSLNLKRVGTLKSAPTELAATHYYIRYQPASFKEYEDILADKSIHVFESPLVMDSLASLEDTTLTALDVGEKWFYTVVPVEYTFLPIKSEIIDELYQPNFVGCDTNSTKSEVAIPSFWYELEYEAMRQAGYVPSDYKTSDPGNKLKWSILGYIPTANVKVYDDATNTYVPVAKVKVTVRNLTIFWISTTGNDGKATFPRYGFSLKYELFFEDSKWNIRDGEVLRSYIEGPTKTGTWDKNIYGGKESGWATIQRGCSRYHYKNIGGLRRPFPETLKICYYHTKNGNNPGVNWGILWQRIISGGLGSEIPNIKIWQQDSTYYTFETIIHELGHASHIFLMKNLLQFADVPINIRESWATAIEWYISKIEYTELGVPNYNSSAAKQGWPIVGSHNYSPIFIDLVDNHNQSYHNKGLPTNRCPSGGSFDGANCIVYTPPMQTKGFIYNNSFYHSPLNQCDCQSPATYDGANCFVLSIPNEVLPFIYNNSLYYYPAGNASYPFDQITGYSMGSAESDIVSHAYGMGSLRDYIKLINPLVSPINILIYGMTFMMSFINILCVLSLERV